MLHFKLDLKGCILVGKTKARDFIGNSRAAFDKLFARIQQAAQREKIFIEVTSAAPAARGLGAPAPAPRGLVGVSPPPARMALVRSASVRKRPAKRAGTSGKAAGAGRKTAVRKSAGAKRRPAAKRKAAAPAAKRSRGTRRRSAGS
jgi:hypothetical protein